MSRKQRVRRLAIRVAAGAVALGLIVYEWVVGGGIRPTADLCMLATAVAVLCAGTFFYIHWHISHEPMLAWLVTVTVAFALQALQWFTLIIGDPQGATAQTAWVGLYQVGITIGLGFLVTTGLPVRRDPLAMGFVLGVGLSLMRLVVVQIPAPTPSSATYVAIFTALGFAGLVNALRLYRLRLVPELLRRPLAGSAALLGVGQVLSVVAGAPPLMVLVGMLCNVSGAAILFLVAAERSRQAAIDDTSALTVLRRRLQDVELGLHTDQARLHEIRSTIAGISTATDLLNRAEINPARREQLNDMTRAELHRLQRLVCHESRGAAVPTELDAALRPVVVRHQAAGLPVRWQPSGQVALARSDDVAEIVNVLLSNAHRHAGASPVDLTVGWTGGRVEIAVTDQGPGVDAEVRERIFTWGARSNASPGEGVGLATARLLATELDGDLRLDPTQYSGARFVVSLPPAAVPARATVSPQGRAS